MVPSGLGVRREDGSAVGQEGGGSLRLCHVGGKVQLKCRDGRMLLA